MPDQQHVYAGNLKLSVDEVARRFAGELRPGAVVMYTGKALRATGLRVGDAGQARFVVVACACELCQLGRHICVERPNGRHIARSAVRVLAAGEHYLDEGTPDQATNDIGDVSRGIRRAVKRNSKISHSKPSTRATEPTSKHSEEKMLTVAATTKKTRKPPKPDRAIVAAAPLPKQQRRPGAVEIAAEWCDPATLKPWPKNPRKNDGEPVAKVADSIRRFGFAAPIVARLATREIIAGHTRWKAARQLKLDRVPVRFLDITEREAHLLALADNRLGELAEWDTPELHSILASYDLGDQMLAGWSEKDMRELERTARGEDELPDDDAPEVPKNPVTKLGDLWLLGRHRLVCGDCTDEKIVGLARAKLSPFIMVTDPPYGVEYEAAWRKRAGLNNTPRTGQVQNDEAGKSWLDAWRLFTGDVAYVWFDGLKAGASAAELLQASLELRSLIVWRKAQLVPGRATHYHWQHETCWYAVREGKTAQWGGDRKQSTIWDISRKDGSEETKHSTQKPIECMARPIRNHGQAGDVVYDPFCGSGTTLMAAEHLERTCVALEISPGYCDVIVERWQRLTGQKAKRSG